MQACENKNGNSGLNDREMRVFQVIMEEYIRCAEPVGSRKIAKDFELSAATIRNIMADLEDRGLLEQPHVSAGRIPTDAGYRFYVDNFITKTEKVFQLNSESKRKIHSSLDERSEIELVMHQASQVLSRLTNYAGVVVAPRVRNLIFQRIQFVRISEFRILAIFVAQNGMVQNRLLLTDHDYDQEFLDRISRMLNERFADKSLHQIRQGLSKMLEEDQRKYDLLLDSAARLGELAVTRSPMEQGDKVFIEGTFNIIELPEFKDLSRLRDLFRTFTERTAMVRLLDRCLEEDGVSVAIGSETDLPEISDMSVITARYSANETLTGGLGVIGPKRMHYREVISLVSYMASVLSILLRNWDDPNLDFGVFDSSEKGD
ncbi:heat-inducible transcription repressor HrcA [bacterium]|nr:heat-inducible transcription repressor HrcA [candidate division CSSED10-310 bacterium]